MRIPLREPVSPRYIHINSATNKVHLLVPVVGGQEISTDNTCQATVALREFFGGGALRELTAYKEALVFDIGLLEAGDAQREGKEARLAQIEAYIEAVSAMRLTYRDAMTGFLGRPSNLYSIQLRPRAQDSQSRVVNPVFNVNRTNDAAGTPNSPLYNAMHSKFPTTVAPTDPRSLLTRAVLSAITAGLSFADIQQALREQSFALFGLAIDFTQRTDGTPATKEVIDALMGFEEDATTEDYIEALLGACARDVWETLPTLPFYSIPAATPVGERTERLSILTQFFLANLNVHCKARGISTKNFGVVLDASPDLSDDLATVVSEALISGEEVERTICNFCNVNADAFGLSRAINAEDLTAIRQTFERTYRTITTTENHHMDDFMILDKGATGETAKFMTHQGGICVNFAEIIDSTATSSNPDYFASVRADFAVHPTEVPHRNESVAGGDVEIDAATLLALINDEQFERLPTAVKEACRAHASFQTHHFLNDVAKGKQEEAEALLTTAPTNTQTILRTPGVFTDYSGRTFNCTAYEYAYWAKDTHMCCMLERHMDEETKAIMAARIDEIERIDAVTGQPIGLGYSQSGQEHRSAHFDFTPLNQAYQRYLDGYNGWVVAQNWAVMDAAWWEVGKEQRNVPAHVAQEYCRPDRSFDPRPEFNEATFPRMLTFDNWTTGRSDYWFPLTSSNSGLGFNFALMRAGQRLPRWGLGLLPHRYEADRDLAAVIRLDEVRTANLMLLREHLNPPTLSYGMIM